MIESIKCIKNLGPFKSIERVSLAKNTLVFAENGSGKTMLSEVFRSLATDKPDLVAGRKRLGADMDPLVVLEQSGDGSVWRWEPEGWQGGTPKMSVFNDGFVDANVYSGLEVTPAHRQGLHSVVVGEEGIRLAESYRRAGEDVTTARAAKNRIASDIQAEVGTAIKVDDFLALEPCASIDDLICENRDALKRALNAAQIQKRSRLAPLPIPPIDTTKIQDVMSRSIDDLTSDALQPVTKHLTDLWQGGESWLIQGWEKSQRKDICPYCGQDLANSPLVELFKHYFGKAYQDAKKEIVCVLDDFESANDESSRRGLVKVANDNVRLFREWERDGLGLTAPTEFDAESVVATWQEFADGVIRALKKKVDAPLDKAEFDQMALVAMGQFSKSMGSIEAENEYILTVNAEIENIQVESKQADVEKLKQKAKELQHKKLRGGPEISKLCSDYETAQKAEEIAVAKRDTCRKEMSEHSTRSFQSYGDAINAHLDDFNVGFQIREFRGVSPGGTVTSEFVIAINGEDVEVKSARSSAELASFSNTLSGGDRTALALAFFFASLDQRRDLCETVVVIDDPLSSLDAGRRRDTISAVRHYAAKVAQLVVLSHDRGFLCEFNRRAGNRKNVVGITVNYDGKASTIDDWDLEEACWREELARGIRMQRFLDGEEPASRSLYQDIRHHIENYLSLAFPAEYVASSSVGGFLSNHERDDGLFREKPLLPNKRLKRLRDLHEYSNDELHWNIVPESALAELRSYVSRTLEFCRVQDSDSTSERATTA